MPPRENPFQEAETVLDDPKTKERLSETKKQLLEILKEVDQSAFYTAGQISTEMLKEISPE